MCAPRQGWLIQFHTWDLAPSLCLLCVLGQGLGRGGYLGKEERSGKCGDFGLRGFWWDNREQCCTGECSIWRAQALGEMGYFKDLTCSNSSIPFTLPFIMFIAYCLSLIIWTFASQMQGSVSVLFNDVLQAPRMGPALNRCSMNISGTTEWAFFGLLWSRTEVGLPTCGDGTAGPHLCTEWCMVNCLSLPYLSYFSAYVGGE